MPSLPKPNLPGLFTGLKITLGELLKTLFPQKGIKRLIPAPVKHGVVTVQYPHESETPTARARGVKFGVVLFPLVYRVGSGTFAPIRDARLAMDVEVS